VNLNTPPRFTDFQEFQQWIEDLYDFLKYPAYHLLKLVPRSTAPTSEEGLIYYDSDDNAPLFYDGTNWKYVLSNPTSTISYGSCYGNEMGWSQASAVQNTWYKISDSDMADGQLNNVTHDGSGKLTVTEPGIFMATYHISGEDSADNDNIQVTFSVSGIEADAGVNHVETSKANDHMAIGCSAILDLADNAYVEVSVRTTDNNTPTLGIDHLNITLVQVGET